MCVGDDINNLACAFFFPNRRPERRQNERREAIRPERDFGSVDVETEQNAAGGDGQTGSFEQRADEPAG